MSKRVINSNLNLFVKNNEYYFTSDSFIDGDYHYLSHDFIQTVKCVKFLDLIYVHVKQISDENPNSIIYVDKKIVISLDPPVEKKKVQCIRNEVDENGNLLDAVTYELLEENHIELDGYCYNKETLKRIFTRFKIIGNEDLRHPNTNAPIDAVEIERLIYGENPFLKPEILEEFNRLLPNVRPDYLIDQNIQFLVWIYLGTNREAIEFIERIYGRIEDWDVSRVTDMSELFAEKDTFNRDISKWDVSNVLLMQGMFYGAHSFNQPLNSWNVSSVVTMQTMFYGAIKFNQPLDKWDVSNVENMHEMFTGAHSFNQELNSWNVSKVKYMGEMFCDTELFNHPLDRWDVSNVEDISYMFYRARKFNQSLNSWNTSNVKDMAGTFCQTNRFNRELNLWNTSNVKNMNHMFSDAKMFNQNLNQWDVSNVENMESMFKDSKLTCENIPTEWNFNPNTEVSSMFRSRPISKINRRDEHIEKLNRRDEYIEKLKMTEQQLKVIFV